LIARAVTIRNEDEYRRTKIEAQQVRARNRRRPICVVTAMPPGGAPRASSSFLARADTQSRLDQLRAESDAG
jgi:hypothetical protein